MKHPRILLLALAAASVLLFSSCSNVTEPEKPSIIESDTGEEITSSELYDDSIISYSASGGSDASAATISLDMTKGNITASFYPGVSEEPSTARKVRIVETETPESLWATLERTYPTVQILGNNIGAEEENICGTVGGPKSSLIITAGNDVWVDYQMFHCLSREGFNTPAEEWLTPVFEYLETVEENPVP